MTTTSENLSARTTEAEAYYRIRPHDNAHFHPKRPVVILREGNGLNDGTSLETRLANGSWHPISEHPSIAAAIDAFHAIPSWRNRDPQHYRILNEG